MNPYKNLNRWYSIFQWRNPCFQLRWYHGHVYYSAKRNKMLSVIYPFHFVVVVVWWLHDKWCKHKDTPTWIDREINNNNNK